MNCNEFEVMLADELGGELGVAERAAFETHLAECPRCRVEHGSLHRAVGELKLLPAAEGVGVQRVGDQLVLSRTTTRRMTMRWHGMLRYAALIVLAFAAGYASRGTGDAPMDRGTGHLRNAVAFQFARNPARSGLGNCLAAMYDPRR